MARAPDGSPNVVVVLLDDLGFGQLGCFGSDISTPNIDALAAAGLRYNRFHVTALCSPTRAALLTGRNHHAVGMGFLADVTTSDPGYTGRIPPSAAPVPRLLRDAGWNTLAVGKWHLTPRGERTDAGPYQHWPLGSGFERYYGFLRADANHWAPELVRDNSFVEPTTRPDHRYHLTEDLADQAIQMVASQQASAPGKPFYLHFATGAMHSPHHVDRWWAHRYRGRFDEGWEAWRESVFARQLSDGVVPGGTELTERPSWIPAWSDLSADERRLYARMQEVYAGFLSHTDAQIGRLFDALKMLDVWDNTLITVLSDNGASAEGGVTGTVNEHRFSHRLHDDLEANLELLDEWGGPQTYPHYAWGWAWAGNAPFHLWKRYTWLGGTRVPFIAHWPERIHDHGAVRAQFAHAVDLMPTILDACGVAAPEVVDGIAQMPVHGASMSPTFTDPDAPDPRSVQYFEMVGSRSIIAHGWKAATDHVSAGVLDEERLLTGSRDFAADRWSLFRLDDDFAESRDIADQYPEVVQLLAALWDVEAERNDVLPLADSLVGRLASVTLPEYGPAARAVFHPISGPISDEALPVLAGGGRIIAEAEVGDAPAGVLFAFGDSTGGFAAYVMDGCVAATLALPGGTVRTRAQRPLSLGRHDIGCTLRPEPHGGVTVELTVDDEVVATTTSDHGLPFIWQHGGTRLSIGFERGLPVDEDTPPFNGDVRQVRIEALDFRLLITDAVRSALRAE